MSEQTIIQTKPQVLQAKSQVRSILQRQCACGQHTSGGGECEDCRKKREGTLQRRAVNQTGPDEHTFTEHPSGHDFSHLQVHSNERRPIQTKLTVNEPGDQYEQEADRVAEQVMRMPENENSSGAAVSEQAQPIPIQRFLSGYNQLHRQPEDEEEEQPGDEEEETLQAKEAPGQTPTVTPEVQERIDSIRGVGQPLPESTRTFMESRFGHDFSQVRVHTDTGAAETARAVSARAFTLGHDIVFGSGAYTPSTSEGKRLLAHELTHVVQQNANEKQSSQEVAQSAHYQRQLVSSNHMDSIDRSIADPIKLSAASSIQRQYLVDTKDATRISTPQGNFYRYPPVSGHSDTKSRPQFQSSEADITKAPYSGEGSKGAGGKKGCDVNRSHYRINRAPEFKAALDSMMLALHEAGEKMDDESMKQAVMHNAYRPVSSEGSRFLRSLKKRLERPPFKDLGLTFPSDLEDMAKSELAATPAFIDALAAKPGWNKKLAQEVISATRGVKAAKGKSTHHSGLAVDINFPYAINESKVQCHGTDSDKNADALRSAAGVWLNTYAPKFGFDSYNTNKEIWHQEWRNWPDTSADPKSHKEPGISGSGVQKSVAPKSKEQQSVDTQSVPAEAPAAKPARGTVTQPAKESTIESGTQSTQTPNVQTAMVEDAQIDALDLEPKTKAAAKKLKGQHPDIKFTSGRRNVAKQAHAMASNIVKSKNRKWIEKTYRSAAKLQKWIDDNPQAVTVSEIAQGLETTMNTMPESERNKISKHLTGQAFDVQPQSKDADAIKQDIRALPGMTKFLEKEGGLIRWHAQFKKLEDISQSNDKYEQEAEQVAERVIHPASDSSDRQAISTAQLQGKVGFPMLQRKEKSQGSQANSPQLPTPKTVVVIGSPDPGQKYQLQFATAAECQKTPGENTIWLVERTGYELYGIPLDYFESYHPAGGFGWITPANSLVGWLNSLPDHGIGKLVVYSHGKPGLVMLRYGWGKVGAPDYGLSIPEVVKLNRDKFTEDAEIEFNSCNTGTSTDSGNLAQTFATQTGRPVHAWTGRTSYTGINKGTCSVGPSTISGLREFVVEGVSRLRGRTPRYETFQPESKSAP